MIFDIDQRITQNNSQSVYVLSSPQLANEPADLKGFKRDQDLHIKTNDVDDWLYVGPDKQPRGGFTLKVLDEASKQRPSD